MRPWVFARHSLPVFEGSRSRRHADVALWRLALTARRELVRRPRRFAAVETFLQFVGFPRSGHSLVGAIIDAHRDALVSHELDTMGLFEKGFSRDVVFALIAHNAARFGASGRWWNGFAYDVPRPDGSSATPRVIGDKKGDWAVRWYGQDPALLERVRATVEVPCRWLLVVRHPLDNIATMSLRQGRLYDRLRIEATSSADFRHRLAAAQADGRITADALDSMIEDYAELCAAIERMKAACASSDWFELDYEHFLRAPRDEVPRVLRFLGLEASAGFVDAATSIVAPGSNPSRRQVRWSPAQLERVAGLIDRHAFLSPYAAALDGDR